MSNTTVNCHDKAKRIGEAVKQRRLESKMTQEVAAAFCGISKKTLIKIEKGGDVYVSTLLQVFKALGIHLTLDAPTVHSSDTDVAYEESHHEWF